MSTTFTTPKTSPRKSAKPSERTRKPGSYTAARRAARQAANRDRSLRRQLVRGRNLLGMAVLRRDATSRWPFVIIFGAIAAVAVVVLLMLNTATAQSSFTERRLNDELTALKLQEQQLSSEVAQQQSPQYLAEKAAELGMVPGQNPGYLVIKPDGSVEWVEPKEAPTPPPAAEPDPVGDPATLPADTGAGG
ncbi:hypothetical protein EK0264_01805 [Epidermidibacterium keratini]|uniref:Septum formation initiator family protein n=1 Tax=Epidermidibacterium keratini TaxID=1891644 RepID=A0A7L4YIG4_9ACTN|nr:hypothetical protein [Epidermidibacterium keratini]QHB99145.1 hypothetical protein EK0264_01805 [Epidermidibacterium keratini]